MKSYKSIAGIYEHFRKLSIKRGAKLQNKIAEEFKVKVEEEESGLNDFEIGKVQKQDSDDFKDLDTGSFIK